ncbi:MAG: aromatic amino acid lyase, partial [Flavitalea sp.]
MQELFQYGIDNLTIKKVTGICDGSIRGILSEEAVSRINRSQQFVTDIVEKGITVYGINTGFGILANSPISKEDTKLLQYKILQSHSVGVGNPVVPEIAKLMMITKVHSLARGFSGAQLSTIERIIWHIDNNIIPLVPEKGSVGASGDLAPLAHLFLPLIGLGHCYSFDSSDEVIAISRAGGKQLPKPETASE